MNSIIRGAALALVCILPFFAAAQETKKPAWIVSVGSNAVSMPAIKLSPFHPSIQVGYSKIWKDKKLSLVQNFRAGYFYQRLSHHAVPIYTQLGYRYTFKFGLSLEAFLDAGYLHTFNDVPVYKLDENGEYKRTSRLGRAHAMFGYSAVAGYKIKGKKMDITPFVQHQFFLFTPFVKNYVPLLPNSTFHIGTYITLNR